MTGFSSWGNYPGVPQQGSFLANRHAELPRNGKSLLPYGLGRSYGDSCQNASGTLLSSKRLDNFIFFDRETGQLSCEAGVTLAEIIDLCLPHGWFLPVTPGTKYVTVGGAIANDVHGKNHHGSGSFGNHLSALELLRSDGQRIRCSPNENAEWFRATIGGLGLTGFILRADLQLKKVESAFIRAESIKYGSLAEFFTLAEASEANHEYTVAWIDCLARDKKLGRGHFIRGNHAAAAGNGMELPVAKKKLTFPIALPFSLVNPLTLTVFNQLYYARQQRRSISSAVSYDPFFYPLDGILHWNRMYGRNGFVQHQCVIPPATAEDAIREILERISRSGMGSFLVVLKTMGSVESRGLLSFPRSGVTLAIDFPMLGSRTLRFLSALDDVVGSAGGRIYPAKDARMSGELFRKSYPAWQEVERLRDPNIQSDFWRRVTGEAR